MSLPRTYLSIAPAGIDDMFGQAFTHAEIIAGLRRISTSFILKVDTYGVACLWYGPPDEMGKPAMGGKKICVFRQGAIPEFTQLGSGGLWMIRGWRSIFEKVVKSRTATVRQLEKEFKVVLETDGLDGSCVACRREGKLSRAEATGKSLCAGHQEVRDNATRAGRIRRGVRDLVAKLTDRRYERRAAEEINECLSGR